MKGDGRTKLAMSNWTTYTNTKATIVNAGENGHIFAGRYVLLTSVEIWQMIGVYSIIHGVAHLPQLKLKMIPQTLNQTHDNDFIVEHVGKNVEMKQKISLHFFGCQHPLMQRKSKEECPNLKVDKFFHWLRYIWKKAWVLSKNCSMDEQTCKMQGKSVNTNLMWKV